MKFRVDEMHLTQVGLSRITRHPRTMLDPLAQMRIALNAQSGKEPDTLLIWLSKGVCRTTAHRYHNSIHRLVLPSQGVVRVLSTYSPLLMSFPHPEVFLSVLMVILHEKRPKDISLPHFLENLSSSLHEVDNTGETVSLSEQRQTFLQRLTALQTVIQAAF
jgi:hypothetical protein